MKIPAAAAFALLLALALPSGRASATPRVQLEPGSYTTGQWKRMHRAPKDAKLELFFMVKQSNLEKLEALFHMVSDPKNMHYGKHLANEEVHSLVAPEPRSLEIIRNFLAAHDLVGIPKTPNSDIISVEVTIEQAEKLLAAEYHSHAHPDTNHVAMRTPKYSLPAEVASVVDLIAPTTSLPPVTRPFVYTGQSRLDLKQLGVSAKKLRSLYSVDDFVGSATGNRHAVTGFLKQHFHPADLKEFWTLEMGGVKAKCPSVKKVGDGVGGLMAGVEAELDIEYINALGSGIESEFWGFSGNSPDNPQNEPFLKWLQVVSNTSDAEVPLIFSTSYGEPETTTTIETATRTNVEFQKAGVRGISLLFASGDSGAGCAGDKFVPNWPAGSPYVTGVGGTTGVPERAVGLASGGFCNRWPRQKWQEDAVQAYLNGAESIPDEKYYNKSGRGFPDIGAQATDFLVVSNLIPTPGVAGTSCASPTASGVMALLNDVRLAAGKSSLGFLNYFIYQNMDSFNDITEGANSGCEEGGFPAAKGWDPVTGVGTPNFAKLKDAVLKLP
eukprot:CAMPEP_0114510390 /NCGR_PEP_ID=MMETSP0109-20121206/13761_1 /TAXON_ID=29199 /ORGANISM="Chlorarachnion reptans, Strain CCCM449" /LENGTH=553 /DNA_ID=CAMNT_0001689693 /DNA_START=25 /DNA_END=1686 /DNA_ORIENTATION=+